MFNEFSNRKGIKESGTKPDGGFAYPNSSYAPSMFWFWNDCDSISRPEHYARMAEDMSAKGINPGFVHARLFRSQTPFWLSDNWYKCFEAALDATEKNGMHMSYTMGDPCFPDKYLLEDHYDFPHFPVGGIELTDHPELKAVSLDCRIVKNESDGTCNIPKAFFAVAAKINTVGQIMSETLRIIAKNNESFVWQLPEPGEWRVYCFSKIYDFPSQYKINFLDRRLAKPWLELENSKYENLFANRFGKTMGGIFFDLEGFFGYKLAWSDDLAEEYKKLITVDIRERMPLLIDEDSDGLWLKARHDWFACVASLYAECVFEPLDHWCRNRGMYHTCHFWEENLLLQSTRIADYMGMQRRLSMPGTDALFDTIHDPRYFKEAQSVSEFEGRQLLCEALGIAGWHLTPVELKNSANSAIAMGVTQLVLHGANTSRDPENVSYPPDFFDWNPYWRYFRQYSDFVRRASYVNDHGRLAAEVLLFCPLDSVNVLIGDSYFNMAETSKDYWNEDMPLQHKAEIQAIESAYSETIRKLYDARIDYCVADRHYLNKMQVEKSCLTLGEFNFTCLILPPLKIINYESAAKLVSFAQNGGLVYAMGSLPEASIEHGGGDATLKGMMEKLRNTPGFVDAYSGIESFIADLRPCVEFESGAFPLIATRRMVGERSFFWLANNTNKAHKFTLRVYGVAGAAKLWNCETGAKLTIPLAGISTDAALVELELAPSEGLWLVFAPAKASAIASNPLLFSTAGIELSGNWDIRINPDDQPPSNFPEFVIPEAFIKGTPVPQLVSWLNWGLEKFSGFVDYSQTIKLENVSGMERLDLGKVKYVAEVWINGMSAGARMWPPFTFKIGELLKPGENEIKIKVGNLILNAVTRYERYKWAWYHPPTKAELDCGLFGPVKIYNGKEFIV